MARPISDEELQLKKRARRRLIGAIVLVTAVAVVLPMVLDSEPKPVQPERRHPDPFARRGRVQTEDSEAPSSRLRRSRLPRPPSERAAARARHRRSPRGRRAPNPSAGSEAAGEPIARERRRDDRQSARRDAAAKVEADCQAPPERARAAPASAAPLPKRATASDGAAPRHVSLASGGERAVGLCRAGRGARRRREGAAASEADGRRRTEDLYRGRARRKAGEVTRVRAGPYRDARGGREGARAVEEGGARRQGRREVSVTRLRTTAVT